MTLNRYYCIIISFCAWIAVVGQYILMMKNPTSSLLESNIRFFSYFTILSNLVVDIYFTVLGIRYKVRGERVFQLSTLTAITIYILIVGIGYQVLLRNVWNPTGLQFIIDEMLHALIPLLVFGFWLLHRKKEVLNYRSILKWSIFPLSYLIFVFARGAYSHFYPYPFFDVTLLGFPRVLMNVMGITIFFLFLSLSLIWLNHKSVINGLDK